MKLIKLLGVFCLFITAGCDKNVDEPINFIEAEVNVDSSSQTITLQTDNKIGGINVVDQGTTQTRKIVGDGTVCTIEGEWYKVQTNTLDPCSVFVELQENDKGEMRTLTISVYQKVHDAVAVITQRGK